MEKTTGWFKNDNGALIFIKENSLQYSLSAKCGFESIESGYIPTYYLREWYTKIDTEEASKLATKHLNNLGYVKGAIVEFVTTFGAHILITDNFIVDENGEISTEYTPYWCILKNMELTTEQVTRLRSGENFNKVFPYTGWAKDESDNLKDYVSYFKNGVRIFFINAREFRNIVRYNDQFDDFDQPISLQEASEIVAKNLGLEFCRAKENGDVEGVIRNGKLVEQTVKFTLSEAIEELKKQHPNKRVIITI